MLLSCRFDKRITAFAEEKFQRDGIDVKLGSMVVKVTDKEIHTKVRGNGDNSSMPYGMVVWSTGIGPHSIIKDFMQQVGQVCQSKTHEHDNLLLNSFASLKLYYLDFGIMFL